MAESTAAIEAILSNDDASTDEELVSHFQTEMGLSEKDARAWVAKRGKYLGAADCPHCMGRFCKRCVL